MEHEQNFSPQLLKWYQHFPRRYHEGVYLGRDLGKPEIRNPVPLFLGGLIAFEIARGYSSATHSMWGSILALSLLAGAPFFTKKFIFDRRPHNLKNNYPD